MISTETSTETTVGIDALIRAGGSRWQKAGMDRVYFNDLAGLYGLRCHHYGSGNISSATLDGDKISNSAAYRILAAFRDAKLWFDVPAGEFQSRGLNAGDASILVAEIRRLAV